jgi:hypothetical protein
MGAKLAARIARQFDSSQKKRPCGVTRELAGGLIGCLVVSMIHLQESRRAYGANVGFWKILVLWVQGPYDVVVISESHDETRAAAFALSTLKLGKVRGQKLRAFTAKPLNDVGQDLFHLGCRTGSRREADGLTSVTFQAESIGFQAAAKPNGSSDLKERPPGDGFSFGRREE